MLQLLPPDDCRRLTDLFNQAGYTLAALTDKGHLKERASHRYGTVKYLMEQTAEPSAFHTLARWFTIGVSLSVDEAAKVLPEWAIDLLVQSGMLRRDADRLEPMVMLSPLGTLLVASDPVLRWEDDPTDLVLWPNPTTHQLFNFTIRKPFRSAFDLGCGCGIQALGAAAHCESVVAADLNARAAEFSAFNARLNGIANVEFLAGDCYQPVEGRTFDLIVANPPFFITPSSGLMYCENSLDLDLFCRKLAREAPRYLNESGFFQMVCEWVEIQGQLWHERIAEWMDQSGCDAWVLRQYSLSPSKYGSERAHQRPPGSDPEGHEFFSNWISYVHQKKITAIHGGLIAMRKRSGANWLRIEDEPVSVDSPFGDLILEGFEARDLLDGKVDAELMELSPRLAQHTRLVQVMGPSDQGWSPRALRLQLTGPRSRQIDIDPGVAQFIGGLTGAARLGQLIQQMAGRADAPPEQVARECVAVIRKLLAQGYLQA
jgi:SAM-dependent methyltransferase